MKKYRLMKPSRNHLNGLIYAEFTFMAYGYMVHFLSTIIDGIYDHAKLKDIHKTLFRLKKTA